MGVGRNHLVKHDGISLKHPSKPVMATSIPLRDRQISAYSDRSIGTKVSRAISKKIRSSNDPYKPFCASSREIPKIVPMATNKSGSSFGSYPSFGSPKPAFAAKNRIKLVPPVAQPILRRSNNRVSVTKSELPDDIDIKTKDKELYATDYVQEIYEHFFESESCVEPYLHKQSPNMKEGWRGCMVDFTVQIHSVFHLSNESLYLAIDILDRFFSQVYTEPADYTLVCLACLLIASKYEDIYPPLIDKLASYDNAITTGDILDMETRILKALDYRISNPTSLPFLIRFSQAAHADKRMSEMAHFILEGTLLSYSLLCDYKPSELAAASVLLARHCAGGRSNWSVTLEKYTGYGEDHLTNIARAVLQVQNTRRIRKEFRAVDKKYTNHFGGVAASSFPRDIY